MIYRINKHVLLEEATDFAVVKAINKHDKIVAATGVAAVGATATIGYGKYKDAKHSDSMHGQEQLEKYNKSKDDKEVPDSHKQEETAIDAKDHSQDEI